MEPVSLGAQRCGPSKQLIEIICLIFFLLALWPPPETRKGKILPDLFLHEQKIYSHLALFQVS